jgi:hypothetical protein
MKILDDFIRQILRWRLPKIDYFMKHPIEVQDKTLHYLVQMAKNTEWGKKYHYNQIKSYQSYQNQVPVSAYEDLFPYIERMLRGEQNILWNTPIYWFSKSSGTTNARSKFIPVSRECLRACHFRGGRDVLGLYLKNEPSSRFFWGRGLSIGGTFQPNPENPKIHYGDISAVIVQNLPKWAQDLRTPPLKIAMMDKWEEKIEAMANHTLKQNITSLLGVPTWTVVLLQRLLEMTGKNTIHEVWPNLEVFVHGAVAFTPYRELFKTLAPNLKYLETYNASEGFFGLQEDMKRDDMLLMLDYEVYYEFIPMVEIEQENPRIIPLSEVEIDKNYAMLISTSGGLWRYKIGDTVKFTSTDPYRIKISGRTKQFINAFGEEVIVENAESALAFACSETKALVSNFTAGPVYMQGSNSGGHEWIIEFEKSPENLSIFIQLLDEKLREINSDYDAKRYQDIALKTPIVHQVPNGTFYNWLKKRGKLGGQNKVPRLANSREYLDEILSLLAQTR